MQILLGGTLEVQQHLLAGWEASAIQGRELQDFRDKIAIPDEEESKLGMPEDQRGYTASTYLMCVIQTHCSSCRFAIGVASHPNDQG